MIKKILVTGANGDFGQSIVRNLLSAGHTVIASMRDTEKRNQQHKKELESIGAYVIEMDVTNDWSVERGIDLAIEYAQTLDGVVNNAGLACYGIQDEFSDHDWQKIFDVNVFGVQRINRAIIPHLKKNNQGFLLHVSSLIGRMILPYWGPYSASKWALEALAETYRVELAQFNIDSCIIEPGPYATSFFQNLSQPQAPHKNSNSTTQSQQADELYIELLSTLVSSTLQNSVNVATAIRQVIELPTGLRPLRTVVDSLGIGDHIARYNEHHEKLTYQVYQQFGIEQMQQVKNQN